MKKSLVATATLLLAGTAFAQSSVTLFGLVDANLSIGRGSLSDSTQLANSGYQSSRLGFRGTEDLGGGMSASFWLEAGVNNDNGSGQATNTNNQANGGAIAGIGGGQGLSFNRRSTVSMSGGFGEIRLGRDYSPQFWNLTVFDAFGSNGVGASQTLRSVITGVTSVRASNSFGYILPGNLGGFYGALQYYLGENNQTGAATEDDGRGTAVRVGYAAGPLNVALALSRTNYAAGDVRQDNVGAHYQFPFGRLMAQYSNDKNGALTGKGWQVGGLFPVGVGEIRAAYSMYKTNAAGTPKSRKVALGYVHNLSKRTAVYATAARVRNSGGATQALGGATTAANASSTGFDFGLRHSF